MKSWTPQLSDFRARSVVPACPVYHPDSIGNSLRRAWAVGRPTCLLNRCSLRGHKRSSRLLSAMIFDNSICVLGRVAIALGCRPSDGPRLRWFESISTHHARVAQLVGGVCLRNRTVRVRISPRVPILSGALVQSAEATGSKSVQSGFESQERHHLEQALGTSTWNKHGGQARLGERRTPNPALQSSILWSPAKFHGPQANGERTGRNPVELGSIPRRSSTER